MTWQPIETAPKDGSVIRVKNLDGTLKAWWFDGQWETALFFYPADYFTEWAPIRKAREPHP